MQIVLDQSSSSIVSNFQLFEAMEWLQNSSPCCRLLRNLVAIIFEKENGWNEPPSELLTHLKAVISFYTFWNFSETFYGVLNWRFSVEWVKGIAKWAEPCKCVIRLVGRILWHERINPSLKEWRFWYLILTDHFPP